MHQVTMTTTDNLVQKLCGILLKDGTDLDVKDWRLLGQEQDGTLLFTWVEVNTNKSPTTNIGLYNYEENTLRVVCSLPQTNIIQASVNTGHNLLGYVTKNLNDQGVFIYKPFLCKIHGDLETKIDLNIEATIDLNIERPKQVMVQFLYHKPSILNEARTEKFLLLVHEESITQYTLTQKAITEERLLLDNFLKDIIVRVFLWAQWDAIQQTLFYIHQRKPIKSLVEGENSSDTDVAGIKTSPMLSGLQFHEDLPHESVLNIPLNLPHISFTSAQSGCGIYEDDTVPLRVHNCSLDLVVVTDPKGIVCICHHYIYQPIQSATALNGHDDNPVNFAYSVTILHHGCVIHCVIPEIPFGRAKCIRPLFKLYDDYMLVFIPGICCHLLDIGFTHDPCCHIVTTGETPGLKTQDVCLTSISNIGGPYGALNMPTLDIVDLRISIEQLAHSFKTIDSLENKMSIMHYLLVHKGNIDAVVQLIQHQVEQPSANSLPQLFKEFLIGNCYASVWRNLPTDAKQLIELLPVTMLPTGCDVDIEVNESIRVCLSQDALWNASMMLLSPQQRIVPFRADIWVKLWERLVKNAKGKTKFRPAQVAEKLLVSLVCYQPEALSRSSTPMSPSTGNINNLPKDISSIKNPIGSLPFYEMESCTASKQEHIISVNLRELSMHLLKQSTENRITNFQWQSQTPLHAHAVATRYIGAQLEQSRHLCQILCQACTQGLRTEEKGFVFIDQLPDDIRLVLFTTLEQYCLAIESIAFPLPLGFTSFFTFLGYRTLEYNLFLQYVDRHVFELQIDVMKIIMADMDDTKANIKRKLTLLSMVPKMRTKRLLNQWQHPVSLTIRAREHAANIMSGSEMPNLIRNRSQKSKNYQLGNHNKYLHGLAAFPTSNRLSPLDTFLDLLTAKASLNELDFGLLIEATVASTEENF